MAFSPLQSLLFLPLAWTSFALDQHVLSSARAPPCNGQPLPEGVVAGALGANININSNGPRSYLLHVPLGFDNTKAAPVYFSFHGATKDASEQEQLSQLSNSIFNPDGIAVYPQSLNGKWYSNPDKTVTHPSPNDLDFIADILTDLRTNLCIDTTAVYASGKSNGGGFTNALACNATVGSQFAAFAAVSGAYYDPSLLPPCAPGTLHTPFLELHGLDDCIAPYTCVPGATTGPCRNTTEHPYPQTGVAPVINQWLALNGCNDTFDDQVGSGLYPDVLLKSWTCQGRPGVVQHYSEANLGHVWPALAMCNDDCRHIRCPDDPRTNCGAGVFSTQCPQGKYTFNATSDILAFFARYSFPTSRS